MNRITLGSFAADAQTKKLVLEVLESGRLSYGEKSSLYERKFASLHECDYGVVSNSGTSSLQVAVQALKEIFHWPDGAEVIVPALTFVATVNVLLHNRLTPVFVDVEPDTYTMDVGGMERAITPRTVAVMPVHLFGHPANMAQIMGIAYDYHLRVVEDACEAMLAVSHGRTVGAWGDVGCFSTYAAHHMVTGVGGMATTKDEDLALVMRSLVNHGISLEGLPAGKTYDPTFLGRKFEFDRVGHSFRITELEAAIGLAQLDLVEEAVCMRQQHASLISTMLRDADLPVRLPQAMRWAQHSWMVYPIVLQRGIDRAAVLASLNAAGVETRLMMPLINQPCYSDLLSHRDVQEWPVAAYINDFGFYVGCHQGLDAAAITYLVDAIADSVLEHA